MRHSFLTVAGVLLLGGTVPAQQPPAPLKVMAAGSSFDFTTASDEFVSQNAETAHDAAAVVRFAS